MLRAGHVRAVDDVGARHPKDDRDAGRYRDLVRHTMNRPMTTRATSVPSFPRETPRLSSANSGVRCNLVESIASTLLGGWMLIATAV